MAFELGFQPFEKGKGVGCRSGESCQYLPVGEATHLAGVTFHDGLSHGHLAVGHHDKFIVLANGQNGRAMPAG